MIGRRNRLPHPCIGSLSQLVGQVFALEHYFPTLVAYALVRAASRLRLDA